MVSEWIPLQGKVSIVTGGGQGIGAGFADTLAAHGSQVMVADLNVDSAHATAEHLRGLGHDAVATGVDVADDGSVRTMLDTAVAVFGRVDVLLNNAAVFSTLAMKSYDEIPLAEWRHVIDVNLTGVFNCCQVVGRRMQGQGTGGSIINVSSSTVLSGRPNYLHYVASKAGVVGLTRSLARELGEARVTVNALMPGSVETGVPRDSAKPSQAARIVDGQAIKRRLVTSDIVGAAVFLASDMARMITGQSIVVDGGMNFL